MRPFYAFLLASLPLWGADDFSSFMQESNEGFSTQKTTDTQALKAMEAEFDAYKKVVDEEFNAFKEKLSKIWDEPAISTQKQWVEYSKDLKERRTVDFEKGTITIDVHAQDGTQAQQAIAKALIDTITKDTKQAYDADILTNAIESKLKNTTKASVTPEPILAPVLFKKPPTIKQSVQFAKKEIQKAGIKQSSSKLPQLGHYTVTLKMPADTVTKKADQFYQKASQEANAYKIPIEVVMGVMHTESAFNPMARSHIPAYGLMQIVPRSAGRDVYSFLYGQSKILSPSYLHNPDNNIKMGTVYLHILYYKYLKAIQDPQSRLYCSIAAYNTGAGNVSKTFSGTTSPLKAAKKINTMSSKEVYNYMIKNLKYQETRDYLQRVASRAAFYKARYN